MREYGRVGPKFWIGRTGKDLRKQGIEAQIVGLYLLTSPHSNMLGLYFQPVMYIAHETGLGLEGASKGLLGAIEAGFCAYDEASEMVWVYEMAKYQIADQLTEGDKRCIGVQNEYNALPANPHLAPFFDRYKDAFHLTKKRVSESPIEAPSKGQRSQAQAQAQAKEHEQASLSGTPDDEAEQILAHLNAEAKRDYRPVPSNIKLIRARLKEGATPAEMLAVIDMKVRQWANDPKMAQYLRPDTLFNATKFAQYIGQLRAGLPLPERSVDGFLATFDDNDGMTIDMETGHA